MYEHHVYTTIGCCSPEELCSRHLDTVTTFNVLLAPLHHTFSAPFIRPSGYPTSSTSITIPMCIGDLEHCSIYDKNKDLFINET